MKKTYYYKWNGYRENENGRSKTYSLRIDMILKFQEDIFDLIKKSEQLATTPASSTAENL